MPFSWTSYRQNKEKTSFPSYIHMCIKIQLLSFFYAMCADSTSQVYLLWQSFYLCRALTRHEKTSWCLYTLVFCIPCLGMSSSIVPILYRFINREELHNGIFQLSSDVYQSQPGKSHPGWTKELLWCGTSPTESRTLSSVHLPCDRDKKAIALGILWHSVPGSSLCLPTLCLFYFIICAFHNAYCLLSCWMLSHEQFEWHQNACEAKPSGPVAPAWNVIIH